VNSTISPLRRIAATVAIAGVTTFGAVALAPSASAAPVSSASQSVSASAPAPAATPVAAPAARAASAVAAAPVASHNSTVKQVVAKVVAFLKSLLAKYLGKTAPVVDVAKECDQSKPADHPANVGCVVAADAPRF
jgi:hypothetical protein